MIVEPKTALPLCNATCELISRILRPYLFCVTVIGIPPHAHTRLYSIRADTDDSAALKGMELFVKEFTPAAALRKMETLAPKAVRQ